MSYFVFTNSGYVQFLCDQHPEIIDDALLEDHMSYTAELIKKLKITTQPIEVSNSQAADILHGQCNMSQRSYKNLKKILKESNIHLPKYEAVIKFRDNLDVGNINLNNCCNDCYSATTSLQETLQLIASSDMFKRFEFKSLDQQQRLATFLKTRNNDLFKTFDPEKRTIFLRQTGDNFRACAKMPTEQVSVAILNVSQMVNNPYCQYINGLWKGSETREGVEYHMKVYLKDLDKVSKEGVDLMIDNQLEHFNVLLFLVTDIGLLEKILGKCSSTSLYGCFWCDKVKNDWDNLYKPKGKQQSVKEMTTNGQKGKPHFY